MMQKKEKKAGKESKYQFKPKVWRRNTDSSEAFDYSELSVTQNNVKGI